MHDFFIALVSFFIVDPLEQAVRDRLVQAELTQQRITQVTNCLQAQTPVVVERAVGNPVWMVMITIRLWTGSVTPQAALEEAAPACAQALSGQEQPQG